MNRSEIDNLEDYYRAAESWSEDRTREITSSKKIAWIIAAVATAVALIEGIALIMLLPLKTVVPYTLLVDRQTGYVEELKPLEQRTIDPDAALVRSFLVQYVIGRESFDINSVKDSYRKVALWSADEARTRYVAEMQATNPESPFARLPRSAVVQVRILSVSSIGKNSSMVRFTSQRNDGGAPGQPPQNWVAVVNYRFSGAAMSAEDRMTNPLGFQVVRYRRNAETLPEPGATIPSPTTPGAALDPPGVGETAKREDDQ